MFKQVAKNSFQKLKSNRSIRAHRYVIVVGPSSTLKKNSHFDRRLTDKPDIFLESLDNSEQNQHRCIFYFC